MAKDVSADRIRTMEKIGIMLALVGGIILSYSECLKAAKKYINFKWKERPAEVKVFCCLTGITNDGKYRDRFGVELAPKPGSFSIRERIIINLPLYGLYLFIAGTFLVLFSR